MTLRQQRPVGWDDHGECLYRYALVRVRKPEVAEDLVQETFLAAVRGYEKVGGRSSERSWLVGILKNKIVDHFRKLGRKLRLRTWNFFPMSIRRSLCLWVFGTTRKDRTTGGRQRTR